MPELYFKGKEFVYNHHLTVPYRPLETQPDKSVGEDSGNLIIHGDNLHALKALLLPPSSCSAIRCPAAVQTANIGSKPPPALLSQDEEKTVTLLAPVPPTVKLKRSTSLPGKL